MLKYIIHPKSKNLKFSFYILLFFISHLCAVGRLTAQEESVSGAPSQAEKREAMSGNVTLDFKEADIRNVLKIISYKSGVNIVATADVMGTITISLKDVPWEKALDTIVKTYGFGYEWLSNKVIMVSTLEKLAQQRKAQQEVLEIEPLDTEAFVLNFSRAEDIKTTMEKLISTKGKISLESRTNTLIISDIKSNLMKIGEIIKELDRITPQVMIEAKLIETTLGSAEKLGIDWTMRIAASGSVRPTTFPFTEAVKGTGTKMFPKVQVPNEVARVTTTVYDDAGNPISSTTEEKVWSKLVSGFPAVSADKFLFGSLDFSQFKAVLEILSSRSDTKIISNPRITTLNNQEAKMVVGTIVPIPTYEYSKETGTRTISGYVTQEVGIKLIVTPNINEQNYITLNVKPNIDEITGWTGPNNERPIVSTRSAETKVMIKDGQTLVIGGLISEKKIKSKRGFPILKNIPILNFVFGKKEDTLDKTELLIFITPHIVKEGASTSEETAKLEERLKKGIKKK